MQFWDHLIKILTRMGMLINKVLTYVGLLEKANVADTSHLAIQLSPIKPTKLYSRYDADPKIWVIEQLPVKIFQNRSPLPEKIDPEFYTLSKKRKKEHIDIFQRKPQKCSKLIGINNIRINKMIEALSNDPKGPFVIPSIIDHWTTIDNFKSILNIKSILGNLSLKKRNIPFDKNAFDDCDLKNGDEDVICFAAGGFVDYHALRGSGRIRVRIDATKLQNVKYNTFFKAVDLCVGPFCIEIQLTEDLKVEISHSIEPKLQFIYILNNKYCTFSELENDELIFYGNILQINKAALLLPFIALEKGKNKETIKAIYDHLNTLDELTLRKLMIAISQNATMYSEFNVYSKILMTPHLIYDIHFVREKETFPLYNLSSEIEYEHTLNNIINSKPEVQTQAVKNLEEINIVSQQRGMTILYGRWIDGHQSKHKEKVEVNKIPSELFSESYIETRPGIRKVY